MIAVVTCLFKSGNKNCFQKLSGYFDISRLQQILEKVVTVQLVNYSVSNDYFGKCQFCYRQGHSTVDAVLCIVNELCDSFDAGATTIGVFLDLSKAFDSLNMNILFNKLRYCSIDGMEVRWFMSYFSARKQCVKYKGIKSDLLSTKDGVAQGSIVGPILNIIL